MPLRIGLTGGIGAGKTAVSDRFAALGIPIIDTDQISRDLVTPGQPALGAIATQFGESVISSDGNLNRAALRQRIFADTHARRELEAILHPRIRAEVAQRISERLEPYLIVVVPLLFESGFDDLVDRILVVDVPEDIQRARVLARDGGEPTQIDRIIGAQIARTERLSRADDVIVNTAQPDALDPQIEQLHQRYLGMAT
ncbi:MAG: dephospho-CoA kinase [Gammaproteobacteria bacterium]|nr:dephospho-CoA kinase [Gammaproteobacteria bacterium]MCP5137761.1 dephospho-CoA kinase [Gammaproteobacteria bacterium]